MPHSANAIDSPPLMSSYYMHLHTRLKAACSSVSASLGHQGIIIHSESNTRSSHACYRRTRHLLHVPQSWSPSIIGRSVFDLFQTGCQTLTTQYITTAARLCTWHSEKHSLHLTCSVRKLVNLLLVTTFLNMRLQLHRFATAPQDSDSVTKTQP
ncbi:hypothetical protein P280DRAFT_4021 [Massarina eburnea CBS 473.64]|uniref:Uncharacterized protein n=1 Tax=Massarina eburnea CBS 473.64 TaxID=1395130 RepID=A0A6A6SGZ2_9PLEO|nr:hypothetical protein P280DRAFT_4021 [Massarina eburnea CBS 473.64]